MLFALKAALLALAVFCIALGMLRAMNEFYDASYSQAFAVMSMVMFARLAWDLAGMYCDFQSKDKRGGNDR